MNMYWPASCTIPSFTGNASALLHKPPLSQRPMWHRASFLQTAPGQYAQRAKTLTARAEAQAKPGAKVYYTFSHSHRSAVP